MGDRKNHYTGLTPAMAVARAKGRKGVTRRKIVPDPGDRKFGGCIMESTNRNVQRGDLFFYRGDNPVLSHDPLHVRRRYDIGDTITWLTTWSVAKEYDYLKPTELPIYLNNLDIWSYHKCIPKPEHHGKLRPGRFMPKWMRIYMPKDTISCLSVERVQDITEKDALSEGITVLPLQSADDPSAWYQSSPGVNQSRSARGAFRGLWNSIHEKRGFGWDVNPYVWVVEFEMEEQCNGLR